MTSLHYLATPISHIDSAIVESRYRDNATALLTLTNNRSLIYSPMMHWFVVAAGLPKDWSFWERASLEFLERCDALIILTLPGWKESRGVLEETYYACKRGKPVSFMRNPTSPQLDLASPAELAELLDLRIRSVAASN